MSGVDELARRYRRWLRWYPQAFRDEYDAEMLGVLLECAREGQGRPTATECMDLMANGLRMRLRAGSSRPVVSRPGMVLISIGAALEVAAAVTIVATAGSVRGRLIERIPGLTDAEWGTIVADHLAPVVLAACIAAACWLGLGWSIRRGHRLAKVAFAAFFGLNLFSLFNGLAGGSAALAPAAVAVGATLCFVQFVAVVLIFDRELAAVASRGRVLVRSLPPDG